MGDEYRLSFKNQNRDDLETRISRLSGTKRINYPSNAFEYRHEISRAGMPDATISITEYGLYFCDRGGHGKDHLGRVIALLVSEFGSVLVEELE